MNKTEQQLLRWQFAAQADYLAKDKKNYLLVAVPGAGKTFWALHTAREMMKVGKIRKIVIVVPTSHLKNQWASAAHKLGLDIAPDYLNKDGWWPRDADGVVMTYAQMHRDATLCRVNVSKFPTLVIPDEVHHLQDESSWGESAQHAFDGAARRILLSGTPWNRDGFIPWVEYQDDGTVTADKIYTYYESLVDAVNCDVFFPTLGGRAEWFDGQHVSRNSTEIMSEKDRSRWLATTLTVPAGDFLPQAFPQADSELSRIRDQGQVRAGGMIIAKSIEDADKTADYIQNVLRKPRPVVITSDKPGASDDLKAFCKNSERWCISIRMVSEGVDIPRLRVLIYATNFTTRLFFRQAVGRVIRGPEPPAKVYIPEDSLLVQYALEFREERMEALRKTQERIDEAGERMSAGTFFPLRGEISSAGVIHADDVLSQSEIDLAYEKIRAAGDPRPTMEMATIVAKIYKEQASHVDPPAADAPLQSERKKALRDVMSKMVSQFVSVTGQEYSHVQAELNRLVGVRNVRECDEGQLNKRYEILKKWLEEARSGRSVV